MRETIEWIETVEGWNILVSADREKILRTTYELEPSLDTHTEKFGDGSASKWIMNVLLKIFKEDN